MSTPVTRSSRPTAPFALALAVVVALLVALAPAAAARDQESPRSGGSISGPMRGVSSRSLTVTHGPVVTTLTTAGSDGHQLGDLRVTSLPLGADGTEGEVGRLDASLLTTSIDQPNAGDEIRISTLIFTLGDAANQVVVTGSGLYPAAGSTIAIDSVIVRPITGGSGRFAGVSGWAESEHLADGTWRHTLNFTGFGPVMPRLERRERSQRGGVRERGEQRQQSAEAGVVRTLLGETEPSTADGQALGLWHYVIPAGESLVPHTHPGYQVARIVSGALRYEVISGDAQVVRRDGSTESVGPGGVVTLMPGDAVIENPDLVHFGANEGRRPVVILTATLFETGAEPASPVESVEPAEPVAAIPSAAP